VKGGVILYYEMFEERKKKARRIKDLEVEFLALCDKAATGKTFFIKKRRRDIMEELLEILKSIVGEDEITDESIERLKALSEDEESMQELKRALDTIEKYMSDELPDDFMSALKVLIRRSSYGGSEKVKKIKKEEKEDYPSLAAITPGGFVRNLRLIKKDKNDPYPSVPLPGEVQVITDEELSDLLGENE
jgi:hypothetical protein